MGIPGLFIAFFALRLTDPVRGINENSSNNYNNTARDSNNITHDNLLSSKSRGDVGLLEKYDTNSTEKEKSSCSNFLADILIILKIKPYILANIGLVFLNFSLGGLSSWYM